MGRRLHLARANKPRKDAYGILLAVLRSVNEPEAAIASFHAEANADNRGFKRARETLRQHILNSRQSGSLRSAGMRPSPKSSGLLLDRAAVTRTGLKRLRALAGPARAGPALRVTRTVQAAGA